MIEKYFSGRKQAWKTQNVGVDDEEGVESLPNRKYNFSNEELS